MKDQPEEPLPLFGQLSNIKALLPQPKETPPTFDELWTKAEQAITELNESHPEKYVERATKSERVPLLMPRRREANKKFITMLKDKGVIITGKGRTRKANTHLNKEVEAAYEKVNKERLTCKMLKYKHGKLDSLLEEIAALPALNKSSLDEVWRHWLTEAFMDSHNYKPEESPELLKLVKERVDRIYAKREDENKSATKADYRNEIKKDFRKAIPRLAREESVLWGR